MSDANLLRLIIALVGIVVIAVLYYFGKPRKHDQGRYRGPQLRKTGAVERVEPTIGGESSSGSADDDVQIDDLDEPQAELKLADDAVGHPLHGSPAWTGSTYGQRPDSKIDRIVTLNVTANNGGTIGGSELVVAAEKAGLQFGDMGIFHRLVEGRPEAGPIFSVANMVKPGEFDIRRISELRTPGLSFFMTLPGPLPALDAWDTMLPAAQRLAELLDAQVLDSDHNALGRQTIQHVRDDLRAYDRAQERNVIKPRR